MPIGQTLLDFGIAINFFGNYRREAAFVEQSTAGMRSSLLSLRGLLVGGGLTLALTSFGSSLLSTMQRVEMQFAQLKTSLGSVEKATETLAWAKKMGMETALESNEVVDAVVSMTRMGLANDMESRNKNFKALADFTAQFAKPKGMNFNDVVDSVTKASFGNWERLGDNFGIRRQTITTQMENAIRARGVDNTGNDPLKYTTAEVTRARELVRLIREGKLQGEGLKMALVETVGLMSKGGMNEQLKTIAGVLSNMKDIPVNFMESIVGITQKTGSLANAINTTLNAAFMQLQKTNEQGESSLGNLMRFAGDIGGIMTQAWGGVDGAVQGITGRITMFLSDYKNNIAPIVLFLALARMQVVSFFKAFYDGFTSAFAPFIKAGAAVWQVFGRIAEFLGFASTKAGSLGSLLGHILGLMVGMRAFKFIISPFTGLIASAGTLLTRMLNIREVMATTAGAGAAGDVAGGMGRRFTSLLGTTGSIRTVVAGIARAFGPAALILTGTAMFGRYLQNAQRAATDVNGKLLEVGATTKDIHGNTILVTKELQQTAAGWQNVKAAATSAWSSISDGVGTYMIKMDTLFTKMKMGFDGFRAQFISSDPLGFNSALQWMDAGVQRFNESVNARMLSMTQGIRNIFDADAEMAAARRAEAEDENRRLKGGYSDASPQGKAQFNKLFLPRGVPKPDEAPGLPGVNGGFNVQTLNVTLPNVKKAEDFPTELKKTVNRR